MSAPASPQSSLEPVGPIASAARKRAGIRRRIAFLALASTLVATLLIAYMGYRAELDAAIGGFDAKLRAVALALPEMLGPDYHPRVREGTVTAEEYDRVTARLTNFADQARVYYLYSYIEKDGHLLSASTSATAEERADHSFTPLLDPYKEPPPAILESLKLGGERFASYTDEFGSFRSVFIPFGEGAGRYVVGVDVSLEEVRAAARRTLLHTGGVALAVAVLVGTAGVLVGRRIAGPIRELTASIATFSDYDFTNDDEAERTLERIAAHDTTETGELASTMLSMQRHLREYLHRFESVTKEKQNILSQLAIAREIQQGLLPSHPPIVDGYLIAGWSEPADQAGGDFYDWVQSSSKKVILTIADVTGHGIGPAIMASVCRAYARATLEGETPLRPLIERINRLMSGDLTDSRFVTYFAAVLDPATHSVTWLSAGHGPVLVYRAADASVEEATVHGVPLGIIEDFEFDTSSTTTLHPGDVVLMASDGFWEYPNHKNELFGTDRLKRSLAAAAGLEPKAIIEKIRADVAAHVGTTPQPDDMTAVVVKRV
jgi:serine phosphatase RsbU (regulator of sigma subunit)